MMSAENDAMLQRLARVRAEIDAAAVDAGRDPSEVALLLATKTQPAERILTALTAGHRLIGENRVQEVTAKADELQAIPHQTHFIGHLQANKINQLIEHIDCLETLDSAELARRLNARLEVIDRHLEVFIQVNVSGEESKSGIAPDQASNLLREAAAFPRLSVRGFMTVGLNSPDQAAVRAGYRLLADIRNGAMTDGLPGAETATELSMGMSGDFAEAIVEGATIVRIGSAVFGQRPPLHPASHPAY